MAVAVPLGFILVFAVLLFAVQRSLMYYPQPYPAGFERQFGEVVAPIEFDAGEGRQMAFYLAPRKGTVHEAPERLWVLFHGNASRALDWLASDLVDLHPDAEAGFLLVDFPGFGASEGSPSRTGIIENGVLAFKALADRFGEDPEDLARRTGVLGYSMGAAAGMEFAVRHPVRAVVVISPFTSIMDMARRLYGPFRHVALDRFDNMARLDELAAREDPPTVWIFHGTADPIIPADMGRQLAARQPAITRLAMDDGGDHDWIIQRMGPRMQQAMLDAFGVEANLIGDEAPGGAGNQPDGTEDELDRTR